MRGPSSSRGRRSTRFPTTPTRWSRPSTPWTAPPAGEPATLILVSPRRDVNDNQLITAPVLGPGLVAVPFNEAVVPPQQRTPFSPRIDWQTRPSQTRSGRYTYPASRQQDAGI